MLFKVVAVVLEKDIMGLRKATYKKPNMLSGFWRVCDTRPEGVAKKFKSESRA